MTLHSEAVKEIDLEALADLAKHMGLQGGKMWRTTFADLCKEAEATPA